MIQPSPSEPTLLALDFDGVLCDGMAEYFVTAWRAYCQIWKPEDTALPEPLREAFVRLRPLVETGWEMPLVVRSLLLGIPESESLADWGGTVQRLLEKEGLTAAELGAAVDGTRDQWISTDIQSWLALQHFYPGVCDRLTQILNQNLPVFIVSTKEARFIRQLLQQGGVDFPEDQVIGKGSRQPKAKTLRELRQRFADSGEVRLWFVEDRVQTLHKIEAEPDLADVTLFLADWGYNTEGDRQSAQTDPRIHLISLHHFAQPFSHWLS